VVVTQGATWQENTVLEEISPPGGSPYSEPVAALLEVDGRPAICFEMTEAEGEGYLAYIRALAADGSAWGEPLDLGWDTSGVSAIGFEIVAGHPAVMFALEYKRAGDAQGASWPPGVTLPGLENGYYELIVVNGLPASGDGELFSIALDPFGDAWGEPSPTYGPGGRESLAVIGGKPAFSIYRKQSDYNDLLFIGARDTHGADWRPPVLIDDLGNTNTDPPLAEVAGKPAIAYVNGALEILKFVRALDETGEHWGEPLVLDSRARGAVSMDLLDGRPAVIYNRTDSNELTFIAANDERGTSWGFPALVDDDKSIRVGRDGFGLSVIDDGPAVSYTLVRVDLPELPQELRYTAYR
jgi:hypothetical protein